MASVSHKLSTIFWSAPSSDPKERKLVYKLDAVILSYVCLSYFSNYLGEQLIILLR